jgi:class 3 adenylate cyclase/tetratricopeptide (TPR) repeat protein
VKETERGPATASSGGARTLSFLFADLREYTRFVETRGDRAASELIAEYRRLVRAAVGRTRGAEIKTEGDSFYVVFDAARQALECGIAILQEADLRTRERPDTPIRVGIGVHAGEPVPHEGQYVGSAVNVAARLGSAAGPGELLVSDVVRGLLRTSGSFRMTPRADVPLKGIDEPIRVFAVEWHPLPPRAAQPPAPALAEVAVPAAPPEDRRVLCPILVGREAELVRLDSLVAQVLARKPAVALVGGDAGVGKSALMRAFSERVQEKGVRVLAGECTEVEARRPFGPFVEVVRAAVAASGDLLAERLPPELGRLLAPWDVAGAVDDLTEAERYRIHAAVLHALAEVGRALPIAIVIEDLHWGDEATLELFPYMARKLRETAVVLVATYRTDELHRRHPLRKVIADLDRARLAESIPVRPLDIDSVGEVIRAALKLERPPTEAFRALIHERCEGNPLFVEEVLRALVERGELAYRDGAWRRTKSVDELVIPDSIRDAVLERLGRLDDDRRRILQHAAVIGHRFDLDLLQRVTAADERDLLATIRAAIEEQILETERDPSGDERFAFRHALTREAVLSELLQRERQLMHLAVGRAIEALPDALQRVEELAYHFDEGKDADRARRYRSDAAAAATRVYAWPRAAEHLERAIALAPTEGPELAELHMRLAEVAYLTGDMQRADRTAREAHRMFFAASLPSRAAAALHRVGWVSQMRGDFEEARVLERDAIALLGPLGPSAELALAYARLGRLDMIEDRHDSAIEHSERAAEIARSLGDPAALLYALATLGSIRSLHGDPEGSAQLRESIRIATEANLVEHAMTGFNNLLFSRYRVGDYAGARAVFAEAQEYCRRVGRWSTPLLQWLVWYAVADGDFDRALEAERDSEHETTFGVQRSLYAAMVTIAREGPAMGLSAVDEGKARLLAARNQQSRAAAAIAALPRYIAGDLRGAIDDAEATADLFERGLVFPPVRHAALLAILAARSLGDGAALERWMVRALAQSSPLGGVHNAPRLVAEAVRAERRGDPAEALAKLEEIRPLVADAPPVTPAALDQLRIELHLARGEREAAQRVLAGLTSFWRKAGARWYLDRLSEWARERGLDPA